MEICSIIYFQVDKEGNHRIKDDGGDDAIKDGGNDAKEYGTDYSAYYGYSEVVEKVLIIVSAR